MTDSTHLLGSFNNEKGERYYLYAALQPTPTNYKVYLFFKLNAWESLRHPVFSYGANTLEETLENLHLLKPDDLEYMLDTVLHISPR